jgi:hypothetical protein
MAVGNFVMTSVIMFLKWDPTGLQGYSYLKKWQRHDGQRDHGTFWRQKFLWSKRPANKTKMYESLLAILTGTHILAQRWFFWRNVLSPSLLIKGLSSEMDLAESDINQSLYLKGRGSKISSWFYPALKFLCYLLLYLGIDKIIAMSDINIHSAA